MGYKDLRGFIAKLEEEGLDLELPYRFVEVNGKPFISEELLFHIRKSGF